MTQRTLNLMQNNNLPKRCPSKGSFRFNQFRYKKTRKANYEFGQNNTWKQILRGKLSRHQISQGETQVFRTSSLRLTPREGQQTPNLNMCNLKSKLTFRKTSKRRHKLDNTCFQLDCTVIRFCYPKKPKHSLNEIL